MDVKAPIKKLKARQKFIWFTDAFDRPLPDEIFVDGFAGGGGAGTGIARALGHGAHIAINHDRDAISMYVENHPDARPYCESIFRVNPKKACEGRRVKGAWFSPDCTSHSKAKGGKPKEKKIRALSWVVLHWMAQVRPTVVFVENVEEITKWGPLDENDEPIKEREGEHFNAFVGAMQSGCDPAQDIRDEMADYLGEDTAACLAGLGYDVEWKELIASDYGAPTTRKRLFLVARCDGKPIVWPKPTHGSPKVIRNELQENRVCNLKKWKPVADVIDWSQPWPSIFDTREQIWEKHRVKAVRPLAENTQKRIAEGIRRFVIETNEPFIVNVNHKSDQFRGQSIHDPLPTVTGKNGFALAAPFITALQQGGMTRSVDRPLHTICASRKDCNLVVAPFISRMYGQGDGTDCRTPLGTATSENKSALIAPALVQVGYGERVGQKPRCLDIKKPLGTIVGSGKHALVAAFITKHFGGMVGVPASHPFPTITERGTQNMLTAVMIKNNHGGKQAFDIREPLRTVMAQGQHHAVVGCRVDEVRAFLFKYYGSGGQWNDLHDPAPTITAKDRLALGLVSINGMLGQISDIFMRMLTPRELFDAQGFPSDYKIDHGYDGRKMSKSAKVARCGNSVSPHPAEALVKANME